MKICKILFCVIAIVFLSSCDPDEITHTPEVTNGNCTTCTMEITHGAFPGGGASSCKITIKKWDGQLIGVFNSFPSSGLAVQVPCGTAFKVEATYNGYCIIPTGGTSWATYKSWDYVSATECNIKVKLKPTVSGSGCL